MTNVTAGHRSRLLCSGILWLAVGACDGSSPTAPSRVLRIDQALVSVDGVVTNGSFLSSSESRGSSTVFRASLADESGPVAGETCWIDFSRPHQAGMPGSPSGRFQLHDDGEGCDQVAFDGDYCYEDRLGDYGFHHQADLHHHLSGAGRGPHHYDFWGTHGDGRTSGRVRVTITIE